MKNVENIKTWQYKNDKYKAFEDNHDYNDKNGVPGLRIDDSDTCIKKLSGKKNRSLIYEWLCS